MSPLGPVFGIMIFKNKIKSNIQPFTQWCIRGGLGGSEPLRCDLMGAQPPNSVKFLELSTYMNKYSAINGYFRCKIAVEKSLYHQIWGSKTTLFAGKQYQLLI